eukprot:scaffold52368_cov24-Tisochrysis_lutea.AAC.1
MRAAHLAQRASHCVERRAFSSARMSTELALRCMPNSRPPTNQSPDVSTSVLQGAPRKITLRSDASATSAPFASSTWV